MHARYRTHPGVAKKLVPCNPGVISMSSRIDEEPRIVLPPLGPEADTLDAMLALRAAETPETLAFAAAGDEGGESLSYGRLRREAEALAGGLAGLGIEPGDRVALLLPAGLGFIRAFFALQRLSAVPCALDPGAPPATCARR